MRSWPWDKGTLVLMWSASGQHQRRGEEAYFFFTAPNTASVSWISEHLIKDGPDSEGSHRMLFTKDNGTKSRCKCLTHGIITSVTIAPQASARNVNLQYQLLILSLTWRRPTKNLGNPLYLSPWIIEYGNAYLQVHNDESHVYRSCSEW